MDGLVTGVRHVEARRTADEVNPSPRPGQRPPPRHIGQRRQPRPLRLGARGDNHHDQPRPRDARPPLRDQSRAHRREHALARLRGTAQATGRPSGQSPISGPLLSHPPVCYRPVGAAASIYDPWRSCRLGRCDAGRRPGWQARRDRPLLDDIGRNALGDEFGRVWRWPCGSMTASTCQFY